MSAIIVYNLIAALGLAMLFAGLGLQFGWPVALFATGGVMLALNFGMLWLTARA